MTKPEYLAALKAHLSSLPSEEVEDILRDQDEYIRDAVNAGRSEADVIFGLGDPKAFAQSLTAGSVLKQKIENAASSPSLKMKISGTWSAVIAILALAPLNLIFVLGPFLVALALLVGGWASAFGLFLASIAAFGVFFFELIFISVGFWVQFSAFFFLAGCLGLTLLGLFSMYRITIWFVLGTLAYLKWNLKFIQARA